MYKLAIEAFQNALELEPGNGWIYSNLASAYTFQGDHQDAISLYEQSIELLDNNKDRAAIWNKLGNSYRRLNNRRQATYAYQKAKILSHDKPSIASRARSILLSNCMAE